MDPDVADGPEGMNPIIRLATDADGPAIGKLFQEADLPDFQVDWAAPGIGGWWLVAEHEDGVIVGAINVMASKPFGVIGDIVVAKSARGRGEDGRGRLGLRPGAVGFTLYAMALALLRRSGCQIAEGITALPGLEKILTRYGGVKVGDMAFYVRRL